MLRLKADADGMGKELENRDAKIKSLETTV